MIGRKRKKVVKYRGSTTHGGGSMKKRRGAGHRGGRGNAGSGKRGDAKKPSYWQIPGHKGFVAQGYVHVCTINVGQLNSSIETLVQKGMATEKSGVFTIDLGPVGYDKLLGSGLVAKKFHITVDAASPRAIERIEKAGGTVTVPPVAEAAGEEKKE